MDNTVRIAETELRSFVKACLENRRVPADDAAIVADVLVTAHLCGIESHGIVRLSHYLRRIENGTIDPRPKIDFERTSATTGILDGGNGLGHVVASRACEHLVEMTRDSGNGSIVVRNSSHFGIAGYYVRRLVRHGFAGMAMTPSDALLIPFGGTRPFFGTNPVAIGFPSPVVEGRELAPIVLDMATTSIPFGKILVAQQEGREIPEDWGFDESGKPTTDPDAIVGLHPVAGAKGSGLAMMIDLFTSVLASMPFGPHVHKMYREMDRPRNLGHFLSAWDLSRFRPLGELKSELGAMVSELHAMPPAEGFERVYYPGEIEGDRAADRSEHGIPIEPGLRSEIEQLAESLGVAPPRPIEKKRS